MWMDSIEQDLTRDRTNNAKVNKRRQTVTRHHNLVNNMRNMKRLAQTVEQCMTNDVALLTEKRAISVRN